MPLNATLLFMCLASAIVKYALRHARAAAKKNMVYLGDDLRIWVQKQNNVNNNSGGGQQSTATLQQH